MRNLLLIAALLLIDPAFSFAQESVPWLPTVSKENIVVHPAGKLDKSIDAVVVQVDGGDARTTTRVVSLDAPKVPSHRYQLKGRVKVENVVGDGYVEMLNTFPKIGVYFTKTLENDGPLGKLTGTGDWRDVELPFVSQEGVLPSKIEVNVVLPGKGKVYLTPFTVAKYEGPAELEASAKNAWWSDRAAGLIGGSAGGTFGICGALVGVLAGLGRARRFVMTLCFALIAMGVVTFVMGLVAVSLRQPYHVYYPLLLMGGLSVVILGFNLPSLRRRYEQAELRQMTALDA
jgi:hypothetical protein